MAVLPYYQLRQLCGSPQLDGQQMQTIIDSIFIPRYVVEAGTSFTLTEDHRCAWVFCTNAALVTVTLPAGLGIGFLTSVTPLGAGGATISGTHVGGSTVAQNGEATLATIYDGSWFVQGAA